MGSHPELGHQLTEKYQLQVRSGEGWDMDVGSVLGQDAPSQQGLVRATCPSPSPVSDVTNRGVVHVEHSM